MVQSTMMNLEQSTITENDWIQHEGECVWKVRINLDSGSCGQPTTKPKLKASLARSAIGLPGYPFCGTVCPRTEAPIAENGSKDRPTSSLTWNSGTRDRIRSSAA